MRKKEALPRRMNFKTGGGFVASGTGECIIRTHALPGVMIFGFRDFVPLWLLPFFRFCCFGLPDFAAFFGAAVFAVFFCADCSRFSALVGGAGGFFRC